jgi:hypothetical protein
MVQQSMGEIDFPFRTCGAPIRSSTIWRNNAAYETASPLWRPALRRSAIPLPPGSLRPSPA